MKVMAGRLGLNDGANPVVLGPGPLASGYTGGDDCGPWGLGRRASNDVDPSIVYELDGISHSASSTRYR